MGIKRKDLIELFKSNPNKEYTFSELVGVFKVRTKARKKIMPHLQSLLSKGIISRIANDSFIYSSHPPELEKRVVKKQSLTQKLTGFFTKNPNGYGFVRPNQAGFEDVYLSKNEVLQNGLMNGDEIIVSMKYSRHKKGYYGKFINFVSRRNKTAVGRIQKKGPNMVVELKDTGELLHIQRGRFLGARLDDWVELEIKKYPKARSQAYAEVIRVIDSDEDLIVSEYGIREHFSEKVLDEVENMKEPSQDPKVYQTEIFIDSKGVRRVNLSRLCTVTIDGKDARDFDDAVSLIKEGKSKRLLVSIADVSHYVTRDSNTDKEARKRTSSLYFPGRAIPMLPEILSTDICCLREKRYRYTLTVDMLFDESAVLKESKIYPSVIKNDFRLNYDEVQKIIKADFKGPDVDDAKLNKIPKEVKNMITMMNSLYEGLRKKAVKRGTIFLDIPEPEIIMDDRSNVLDIKKRPRWPAHELVEEFMIAANVEAAKYLKKEKKGIYRVHEGPDEEKILNYSELARLYKAGFKASWRTARDFSFYLSSIKNHPSRELLNRMFLRSLKKALYSSKPEIGHFALSLKDYTHFTSPIRRYPDLLVHRLIKAPDTYDTGLLEHLAKLCSEGELKLTAAERAINRIKQARYMKPRIGEGFTAKITGINDNGLWVELSQSFIEGYLPFSRMGTELYYFDAELMGVRLGSGVIRYKLGDSVDVRCFSVDLFNGKVSFELDID